MSNLTYGAYSLKVHPVLKYSTYSKQVCTLKERAEKRMEQMGNAILIGSTNQSRNEFLGGGCDVRYAQCNEYSVPSIISSGELNI